MLRLVSLLFFCLATQLFAQNSDCGIIYVAPNGTTDAGSGSMNRPASFHYALTNLVPNGGYIRMSVGNYVLDTTLKIRSNLVIEGGFLPQKGWAKTNTDSTVWIRTNRNPASNPSRLVAVEGINLQNFRLQDIRINCTEAVASGASYYGLYLRGCKNYTLSRCVIRTASTPDAINGADGTNGRSGADGKAGGLGCGQCNPDTPPKVITGGAGGNSWSNGTASGGKGGDGGARGKGTNCLPLQCNVCDPQVISAPNGQNGADGNGSSQAKGGIGRAGLNYCLQGSGLNQTDILNFINSCPTTDSAQFWGRNGENGAPGINGFDGENGVARYRNGFFHPEDGTSGTDGTSGSGGGGGGGGASVGGIPRLGLGGIIPDANSAGAGGGGGGEGGEKGRAGTGGKGAFGTFAVFLWQNGSNAFIKDCRLLPGKAGKGGRGGIGGRGGNGGKGGIGGNDAQQNNGRGSGCHGGAGGNGGNGGDGGQGGNGGKGSDGVSESVYMSEDGSPAVITGRLNPVEFPIEVSYNGCTHLPVSVKTTQPGAVFEWFLGGKPLSASGKEASTLYESVGNKTISLFVDGVAFAYTDFLNVFRLNPAPKILADYQTICTGFSLAFQTNIGDALAYEWQFPGGQPASANTATPPPILFNQAGTYFITLRTRSCCGWSLTDTFKLTVKDRPDVRFRIKSQTICSGDPRPVLEQTPIAGATYEWFFNNNPANTNQPRLATQEAGEYVLRVSLPGGCSASDTFRLEIQDSLIFSLGKDRVLCSGDAFPVLTTGRSDWTHRWTRNGVLISTDATIIPDQAGLYRVQAVSRTGCSGSAAVRITVERLNVYLGEDRTICKESGRDSLDAGMDNVDYQWKIDGRPAGRQRRIPITVSGMYHLTILSPNGCSASDSVRINLSTPLSVKINVPAQVKANESVNFSAQISSEPDSLVWNIGTPVYYKQRSFNYTYRTAGRRTVFLVVYAGSCTDTAIASVNVVNDCNTLNLKADFTYEPDTVNIAQSGNIRFSFTGRNVTDYQWNFGDGKGTSADPNPTYAYADTGRYPVKLTVRNYNCADSITKTVIVVKKERNVGLAEAPQTLFQIYPNPASESITITFLTEEYFSTALYSLTGTKLISLPFTRSGQISLSTAELPAGIYLLQARGTNGILFSKKLVIVH
jgi:PKD repeat protein